jgi:uncharacterized protein (DUF1919 family)
MITITNNSSSFFEENNDQDILIYGAGNTGMWTGIFMNRLGLKFSGYLDKNIQFEGAVLNDRPIHKPDKLKDYANRSVKIIVCPKCYKEICFDIMWLARKYKFDALCLVPQYCDFILRDERFNINKFLGYFRRKLIIGELPTIISNDCTDGFLYEALGMVPLSPTINTGFSPEDFVKLCRNPQHYLMKDLSDLKWARTFTQTYQSKVVPEARIDDIHVYFGHYNSFDECHNRWNIMRECINWKRLVFIMQDGHGVIPLKLIKEFDSLQEQHLFVSLKSNYNVASENVVIFRENWLHYRDCVIENNFDLLGWLNE